jgi:monoterpene epsilon-lactone hydrolase
MPSQLDAVLAELKGVLASPPSTIEGFREAWSTVMDRVVEGVEPVAGALFEPVDVGGVPATWISVPGSRADRVVLFTHGGGYAFGSVHTHRDFVARLAQACGARVLGIDYRLAPEHPYPAGVEDTVSAYRWLLRHGVDPSRTVLIGDSAGGGIALAALARIAARSTTPDAVPTPAGCVAISAWLDFEAIGASMDTNAAKDPFNQRDVVLMVAAMYLAGGSPKDASPLYAPLGGVPPLLLLAGGDEVLVDDTRRMAEGARAAGVEVTERIWDGLYHDFPIFDPLEPNSVEALRMIAGFVDDVTSRAAS